MVYYAVIISYHPVLISLRQSSPTVFNEAAFSVSDSNLSSVSECRPCSLSYTDRPLSELQADWFTTPFLQVPESDAQCVTFKFFTIVTERQCHRGQLKGDTVFHTDAVKPSDFKESAVLLCYTDNETISTVIVTKDMGKKTHKQQQQQTV